MKHGSISFRLTVWFSAVFLCGFTVFGLVMWADLAVSLSQGRDRTLRRRATRALETLAAFQGSSSERISSKYDELAAATPEGNLILVADTGGHLLFPRKRSDPANFPWPAADAATGDRYWTVRFEGRKFRVLRREAELGGRTVRIDVGGQLDDNQQMLDRFSSGLAWSIPVLLAASAMAGYLMSRRVLHPVDRLTAALRLIGIGNLSERLPVRPTGDELQRLAETSNEMLERLETAVARIKRFTADASHELRTPLSYIYTVAEYALRHPDLNEETRESFEGILAESKEATQLLEDMLMLARADAGRVDMNFETVDLAVLVGEVCEKARVAAEVKHHMLTVRCPGKRGCEVKADRASLRRLVWTLIDNAIKYTPEYGRVEVALEQNATEVRLKVKDSGIGIPAELLPRVFERFFRADPSRSQVAGTGLGLAIARWIADAHRWDIQVQSTEGIGSVFTVVCPWKRNGMEKV